MQVLLFMLLVAGTFAKPQLVSWFEMKVAHKVKDVELQKENTAASAKLARVSFEPYQEFQQFKTKHGKKYDNMKLEVARYGIFQKNLNFISEHNKKYNAGHKSYYLDVNQFADMTNEEFRMHNGLQSEYKRTEGQCSTFLASEFLNVPSSVDWREKGYVTGVKNQGQCGSCWSFSTTGSLEGQHFHKSGKLLSLSEQQLVDCSGKFGNEGCNGGLMDQAFLYIKQIGGIELESEYPYDAEQERCHFNKTEVVATVSGCVDVASESETQLKQAVGSVGPVSVAIDASHQSFQLYKSGVYDEPDCSSTQLDHGVLTVGYGTDQGQDYWIVKNSWGTMWGEEGYVRMSRNKHNQCGIATQASYPLV